jgi:Protein of unknown function (DUF3119)
LRVASAVGRIRVDTMRTVALSLLLLLLHHTTTTAIVGVEAFAPVAVSKARAAAARKSTLAIPTTECNLQPSKDNTRLYGFFGNFFDSATKANNKAAAAVVYDKVVIDPDFRVAGLFLGLGATLDFIPYLQLTLGPLVTALGVLFFVQTLRIRFVFDEENCIELKTTSLGGSNANTDNTDGLNDSGENVVVGGANRWACDTIVNYDFFPQSWMTPTHPIGPILVYFKETQTDESMWNQGPGQSANDPAKVEAGVAIPGQVHFFPAVCNAQQIEAEFAKRGCGKITVD